MKKILSSFILFLLLIGFSVKSANTALVFIDSTLEPQISQEFAAWTNQVNSEGFYQIDLVLFPRTELFESNRLERISQIRTIIDARQPATVVLVGKLPWGYSGWNNPDGHGARVMASDAHFMIDDYNPTDNLKYGTNRSVADPLYKNIPNDGYWDDNELPFYGVVRSVSRIDLSSLTGSMVSNPAYQYGSGCLKGTPYCPTVEEIEATKGYFRRNLEYRTGRWVPPNIAYMVGGLWDLSSGQSAFTITNSTKYTWIKSLDQTTAAGKDTFLLWNCAAATELGLMFRTNDCRNVKAVWVNTYRSYGSEPVNSCGTLRRWQLEALVSTWGPRWWIVPKNALTVSDAIMATANSAKSWIFLYQLMGDATLPLNPPRPPSAVKNLRIVEL